MKSKLYGWLLVCGVVVGAGIVGFVAGRRVSEQGFLDEYESMSEEMRELQSSLAKARCRLDALEKLDDEYEKYRAPYRTTDKPDIMEVAGKIGVVRPMIRPIDDEDDLELDDDYFDFEDEYEDEDFIEVTAEDLPALEYLPIHELLYYRENNTLNDHHDAVVVPADLIGDEVWESLPDREEACISVLNRQRGCIYGIVNIR